MQVSFKSWYMLGTKEYEKKLSKAERKFYAYPTLKEEVEKSDYFIQSDQTKAIGTVYVQVNSDKQFEKTCKDYGAEPHIIPAYLINY